MTIHTKNCIELRNLVIYPFFLPSAFTTIEAPSSAMVTALSKVSLSILKDEQAKINTQDGAAYLSWSELRMAFRGVSLTRGT
jgi:hypothetical protein